MPCSQRGHRMKQSEHANEYTGTILIGGALYELHSVGTVMRPQIASDRHYWHVQQISFFFLSQALINQSSNQLGLSL